jgi:hypothetical protein
MWKKYRKTATQEMRPYVPGEDLTGISRSALDRYKAGLTEPVHADGERLIALWCESTGSWRDALPEIVSDSGRRSG